MKARRAAALAAAATLFTTTAAVGTATAAPTVPATGTAFFATATSTAPHVATDTYGVTHELNPRVPEGSVWTQHYFPSSDGSGVELHADVLLPEDLEPGQQVPVILSVGPYFSHIGQTGNDRFAQTGPSQRFLDLIEGADLFDEGYAFVMVDLRGCHDWAGPGEQADVLAAIEWSAAQPWSDGNVGMYGKSYDGVTGLIGNNLDHPALKAVVAQEPVWDMYQYIYSNGVPRPNVTGTANAYNSIASLPAMADDDERYKANAAWVRENPECLAEHAAGYRIADQSSEHWTSRDLAAMADGTDTPLFVTQGFIEPNTKPEEMQEYLENHEGPQRGWLGQFDHVRGNDVTAGRLAMGREGWFDEVMSFYDEYLKGTTPTVDYPAYVVQDNSGSYRAQDDWPVVERAVPLPLGGGSYVDDGGASARAAAGATAPLEAPVPSSFDMENAPTTEPVAPRGHAKGVTRATEAGQVVSSYFVWSQPVRDAVRITGTPNVSLTTRGAGNVMVKLYDVAPDGTAVMFDEQVSLLPASGRLSFDLKSTDWTLRPGHVLAVEIGSIQTGSWRDTPSNETITVTGAQLRLALDDPSDDVATHGTSTPYLETYLARNTLPMEAGPASFALAPGGKV
ncbi:hypothetical protein L600_001300000780 [Isoptericola variabilis J7]|uniref:CocE/NonD family hydrolase n=1 Tax=Isoptericola variabilis TaxID=139208 RepID=UPI0011A489BD|nr:CocE/NonD family hydrolase [Isoptericola variabilis]TWH34171.1 hypothetical protein L600_001300000780 [Isoptericola variabilis J7]